MDAAAGAAGIAPGMTLADARALVPGLAAAAADGHGDARALAALADWCLRFTPIAAVDGDAAGGGGGLALDVTGCAHLYGGEAALLARVVGAVRGLGFTVRAALADTRRMAWAAARFLPEAGDGDGAIVPPGGARAVLAPLPAAALGLAPETARGLARLGLGRIGDLLEAPRGPLAARFGAAVARRLDQALGREAEAIAPRRPVPPYAESRVFSEPLIDHAGVSAAAAALLAALCRRLEAEGRGARRLVAALYRLDGARREAVVGTARANRDAAHLGRLLAPHLERLDLGFGVETMTLAAALTEPLAVAQVPLMPDGRAAAAAGGPATLATLATLVDCLANRLGPANVVRLVPRESHLPERAVAALPAMAPAVKRPWRADVKRPPRLFARPERIEAVAMVPDAPPVLFRWRGRPHRVACAEGPERIAAEWWRAAHDLGSAHSDSNNFRDYYRVEDENGGRFWLYRDGPYDGDGRAQWCLHGVFA